jgi:hypothetical protein
MTASGFLGEGFGAIRAVRQREQQFLGGAVATPRLERAIMQAAHCPFIEIWPPSLDGL